MGLTDPDWVYKPGNANHCISPGPELDDKSQKGMVGGKRWLVAGAVSANLLFFQAEYGIRDYKVTGVQTCALPISRRPRTSMQGLGGYARLSKEQGHLLWEVSTNFRTPAYNNNDIAFFSRADYWWMSANIFPVWTKPTRWYRQLYLIAGGQQQYNLDGDLTDRQVQTFAQLQTLSYWWLTGFWIHRPSGFDDRLTRGGPVVRRPALKNFDVGGQAGSRKKSAGDVNAGHRCNTDGDGDQ